MFKFLDKQNNLVKRIFWSKMIWFIISILGFLVILTFYNKPEYSLFMWWILFWYPTIWAMVALMWIFDKHPVFKSWKMNLWRWLFIWAFMNLILVLFAHDILLSLSQDMFWNNITTGLLFLWTILEWAIVWLFIDYITTKKFGEWTSLIK